MASNSEPELREWDEKEEDSSESLAGDEENALPSQQQREAEAPASTSVEEEKPTSLQLQRTQSGPPNGGFKAWMQVAGAYFLFFNTWGVLK